jgi:hypothetical protein
MFTSSRTRSRRLTPLPTPRCAQASECSECWSQSRAIRTAARSTATTASGSRASSAPSTASTSSRSETTSTRAHTNPKVTLSIYAQVMDYSEGQLERLQTLVDGGFAAEVSAHNGTERVSSAVPTDPELIP